MDRQTDNQEVTPIYKAPYGGEKTTPQKKNTTKFPHYSGQVLLPIKDNILECQLHRNIILKFHTFLITDIYL